MLLTELPLIWQVRIYTYACLPGHLCYLKLFEKDETGRLHCGELLKLVDVAAGVCARRHAETACVTICLDKVRGSLRTDDSLIPIPSLGSCFERNASRRPYPSRRVCESRLGFLTG